MITEAAGDAGQPIPGGIRSRFEQSTGRDLSGVRLHTGPSSQAAASAIGAQAYAQGQDVHFAAGKFDVGSSDGQRLLAHEVAHTIQQSGAPAQMQTKLEVSQPSDALEQEADAAADQMVAGQPVALARHAGAVVARSPASVTTGIPDQPIKIPLVKKTISILDQQVNLSISGEVGKKKGVVEAHAGEHKEAGDLEATVKLLEPQLDIVAREAATSFLKGAGAATLFPGLVVKVEGSGPGWSVGKNGVKGQLAAIVLKIDGSVPELLDQIGRSELKNRFDVKVTGQIQIPVASIDQDVMAKLVAESEQLFQREAQWEAKQAAYQELAEKESALSREKAAKVKAWEAGADDFAHKGKQKAEYHALDAEIQKTREQMWKLTHELQAEGAEIAATKGRMAKLFGKVQSKLGKAISMSLGKLAQTVVGKIVGKLLILVNIVSAIEDLVMALKGIIHLVEAEWGPLGGGLGDRGGGSGDDPSDSKQDGQGGTDSLGTGQGTGGTVNGPQGGGGQGPGGGQGAGQGGHQGDDTQPATGNAGGAGDPGQDGAGSRGAQGGAPGGAESQPDSGGGGGTQTTPRKGVELNLNAQMLLTASGVGNKEMDDATRRRLNQLAAPLSMDDLDRLIDLLAGWKPGDGDQMLADLEKAIQRLRSGAPAPTGTPGSDDGSQAPPGHDVPAKVDASPPESPRGPGRTGPERTGDAKDDPLEGKNLFPITEDEVEKMVGELVAEDGSLAVTEEEAKAQIEKRAGDLLKGQNHRGSRGLVEFVRIDGATAPRNIAKAGDQPYLTFKLLLRVTVGGKPKTDLHLLSFRPSAKRAQQGYAVSYVEVAKQVERVGKNVQLKTPGVKVSFGRWEGRLERADWTDKTHQKIVVVVVPVAPVPADEHLSDEEFGVQLVRPNVPVQISLHR